MARLARQQVVDVGGAGRCGRLCRHAAHRARPDGVRNRTIITMDPATPDGAWLLAPYSDMPTSPGLNTAPVDEVRALAALAATYGVQLAVHAIGDRANRETLDLFEATFAANPAVKDWRWRIEHAQHLSAADIPRFGRLGIIASMQGIHATPDAPYVRARLARRAWPRAATCGRS